MADGPLQGRCIVVTRAAEQADTLLERLRELGATPLLCPAIAIAPLADPAALDAALGQLAAYDWLLFTSANTVQALFARVDALGLTGLPLGQARIGAVGPATAQALAARGVLAQFVPSEHLAEGMLAQLGAVAGQRILLPQAAQARTTLAAGLRERGALVDQVVAYHTLPGPGAALLAEPLRAGQVDALTFTSSSTVRYLLAGLAEVGLEQDHARELLNRAAIVCIGPITARTALAHGLQVDAVPEEYTVEGLLAALTHVLGPRR